MASRSARAAEIGTGAAGPAAPPWLVEAGATPGPMGPPPGCTGAAGAGVEGLPNGIGVAPAGGAGAGAGGGALLGGALCPVVAAGAVEAAVSACWYTGATGWGAGAAGLSGACVSGPELALAALVASVKPFWKSCCGVVTGAGPEPEPGPGVAVGVWGPPPPPVPPVELCGVLSEGPPLGPPLPPPVEMGVADWLVGGTAVGAEGDPGRGTAVGGPCGDTCGCGETTVGAFVGFAVGVFWGEGVGSEGAGIGETSVGPFSGFVAAVFGSVLGASDGWVGLCSGRVSVARLRTFATLPGSGGCDPGAGGFGVVDGVAAGIADGGSARNRPSRFRWNCSGVCFQSANLDALAAAATSARFASYAAVTRESIFLERASGFRLVCSNAAI